MATDFEIRIKIGTSIDDASVTLAASALDQQFDRVVANIARKPLRVPSIEIPPIDIPPITLPPIDIPPIDLPPLDFPPVKGISQLALDFDEATAAARKLEAEQKAAMAALIVAGEEGSDQYLDLVASIIETKQQSDELAKAQAKVNNIFKDLDAPDITPAKDPFPAPDPNRAFQFNQISESVERAAESLGQIVQPAIQFEASLAAVGAITGQSGPKLDALGGVARDLALQFGGPATSQLASFQGILSKFGAEVADSPAALGQLAQNINILSKASGDDAATSMSAVTDSMLQFGLVTGDAMKDAATSTDIINALAASAQVGAAEIPQVAEAVLQAGVAAKGANLDFVQTNAALQVLAVGGKVGSEAGISLRNVLGLLQNASSTSEASMAALGTSSKELGEVLTTQGLGPAMDIIRDGMNKLGTDAERNKTLMSIFGTENAAAAGILLDNGSKLVEFEQGIRKGQEGMGAAFEQAAQRMDTSQGQIERAKAFVEDAFISISQTLGAQVTAAAGTFADLAPTLQGAAGLKEIIPDGIFDKAGAGLKSVLLPALSQLGILKKVNQVATIAETAAEVANTAVKGTQAIATGGATTAQYALNTAMLANPALLIVAGIAALTAAFFLFGNSTKDLATATADANAALDEFRATDAAADAANKSATEMSKLADEFDKLEGKGDAESQKRFGEVASDLAERVPEAVIAIDQFNSVGEKTGTTYEANTKLVRLFAEEQRKAAEEAKTNALSNLNDQAVDLTLSYNEALESQKELREDQKIFQSIVAQGGGDAKSLTSLNPFSTMRDDLKDTSAELAEQNKKIADARPAIENLVDGYQEMGLSVDDIAKATQLTVDQVREFKGELAGTLVSSQGLEKALSGMDESQKQLVRSTALQAEGYAQAQQKVDELNNKLADAKFVGDAELTKKLESELDAAQKIASDKKISLEAKLEETGVKEALDAIPEAARSKIIPLTTTLDVVVSDKSLAETQQKAGGVLREISELQKQQAQAIGTANEGAYDNKILAKQNEFRANLEAQAVAIATNETRLNELKAAKDKATDPKEVERLKGEIITLESKTDAAAKQFINAANQGKRVGAIKGDVKDVATEFGFTAQAASGTARAVSEIDSSNKKASLSAAELAEEFKKVRDAATSALEQVKQEAVGLLARIQATNDAKIKEDLQKAYDAKIAEARIIAKGLIDGDKVVKQVTSDIGVTSLTQQEQIEAERRRKAEEAAKKRRQDQIDKVKKDLENDRGEAELKVNAMADGLAKEIAQADLNVEFQRKENELLDKLDRDAVRRGELSRALLAEEQRARSIALANVIAERKRIITDNIGEIGDDFLSADSEALKVRAQSFRDEAERITATDAASITRRTQLLVQALQLSAKAQVDEILNGSDDFQLIAEREAKVQETALIDAKVKLIEAQNKGDQGQIDAAQSTFDLAQRAYASRVVELREQFLQAQLAGNTTLAQTIRNAIEKNEDETTATLSKGTLDAIASARRQLIEQEPDLRRQELLLARLAIDEKLKLDLEANKNNKAKQIELERDANHERLELERAFARESNLLWEAAYAVQFEFAKGFISDLTKERRKELNDQKDDVDKQVAELTESLLRQETPLDAFNDKLLDLLAKQKEISDELAGGALDFWAQVAKGVDLAFASIEKVMTARLDTSAANLTTKLSDAISNAGNEASKAAGDTGDKLDTFLNEFSKSSDAIIGDLVAVGSAASGQLLGIWGQMAATGKATLGDFTDAAIVSSTRAIRTIIEGNMIAIISAAFAINPFVGIGSILAVGLLEVALAKFESDARSRLGGHGFYVGGYTGDGDPHTVDDRPHHKREYILPHQVVDVPENRALAEHLHYGGSQRDWFERMGADWGFVTHADLERLYVDIDGRLRAGFDVISTIDERPAHFELLDRSQEFVAESIEHAYEVREYVDELRATRSETSRIGNATIERLDRIETQLQDSHQLIGAFANYIHLRDYDERHTEAERMGSMSTRRKTSMKDLLEKMVSLLESRR